MTHLPAWDIRVALGQFPSTKSSYIPSTMWSVIHEAVVKQCDTLDGVSDGIISDPSRYVVVFAYFPKTDLSGNRCNFHPEVLACGQDRVNTSSCLNSAQIANLHRIYTPWWESNNSLVYHGLSPGGEAGYSFLFNGATPQFGLFFVYLKYPCFCC